MRFPEEYVFSIMDSLVRHQYRKIVGFFKVKLSLPLSERGDRNEFIH
jgi:hypothetical protein